MVSVGFIVFFFPKGGKFKYEFQKGKPWQFENLYAPFDFSIQKTDDELAKENQQIRENQSTYFRYDEQVVQNVYSVFDSKFSAQLQDSDLRKNKQKELRSTAIDILDLIYKNGILEPLETAPNGNSVFLIVNNEARKVSASDFYRIGEVEESIKAVLSERGLSSYNKEFEALFFDLVTPNVTLDKELTRKALEDAS